MSLKRTRDPDTDAAEVKSEHDPTLDPITCEKWRDPRVFTACGHVWDGVYIERVPFKTTAGYYECTTCKRISQTTIPLRTDCVRSASSDVAGADPEESPRISDILEASRSRRRGIYLRCMNAFYRVLASELETHHWNSEIHPSVLMDPCFIFSYSDLKRRGVFQSSDEFLICLTYRNGGYENFLSADRVRLKMTLRPNDKNEWSKTSETIAFREDPSKFKITVSCKFLGGYDGEYDDEEGEPESESG